VGKSISFYRISLKRFSKRMPNWFIACFQSGSTPQSAVMLPQCRKDQLVAASSLGKWLRLLMILRNRMPALDGVSRVNDTADLRWKNKDRDDVHPCLAQNADTIGNFCPHGPCSNAFSAASAPSMLVAV
jgi:hypothetical protein